MRDGGSLFLAKSSCSLIYFLGTLSVNYLICLLITLVKLSIYLFIYFYFIIRKSHYGSFMARKLYALALEKCAAESADSPMMQEVLLGGHLYLMSLKVSQDSSFDPTQTSSSMQVPLLDIPMFMQKKICLCRAQNNDWKVAGHVDLPNKF